MSRIVACWLVCLAVQGCAHTAQITVWQPAAADSRELGHVVVLPFTGESGDTVSASLTSRLEKGNVYHVVDRTELPMVSLVSLGEKNPGQYEKQAIAAARKAQVDGLIFGHVYLYQCDLLDVPNSEIAPPRRFGPERVFGDSPYQDRESSWLVGTVGIEYRLIDTTTGEERASGKVVREFREQNKPLRDLPSKDTVLANLVEECLDDVEKHLTPHKQTAQVKLATCDWSLHGRPEVRQGCAAAEKGKWREAEAKWQEALTFDAENHAALYNLGVAAANRLDYDAAEDYIMRAIRTKHCDCYETGLSQIRRHRDDYEKAQTQRAKDSSSLTRS